MQCRVGVGARAQHTVWAATGNAAAHSVVAISVLWRRRANALALERRGPLYRREVSLGAPHGHAQLALHAHATIQRTACAHATIQRTTIQCTACACACATALHAPCTHMQGEVVGARTREHVARGVLGVVTREHLQREARLGAIELVVLS